MPSKISFFLLTILRCLGHCTNSAASFRRFDFSISFACTHRIRTTSGAPFEYRINVATTSLYPGELRLSNFAMSLCAYGRPALSVSSKIGAAEFSSTIYMRSASARTEGWDKATCNLHKPMWLQDLSSLAPKKSVFESFSSRARTYP